MAHSGGIITAPVSFADVNATLGTSHTDLGLLCKDSHINKWAKYKPVVNTVTNIMSQLDGNLNWLSSATWWKGTNSNCGITFQSYSTIAAARTAIINKTAIWSYTKPSGGAASPYRLTDFNQYDHNAMPPTTDVSATDAQMKTGATLTITAIGTAGDNEWLKLNSVGDFSNYYYLAAIYDGSGNLKLLQTTAKKVGQFTDAETIEIVIPYSDYSLIFSQNTTYYVFMMLSSVPYSAATSAQNGTYIPLPTDKGDYGMQAGSFECKSDSIYVYVKAYTIGSQSTGVNWQVDLYGAGQPSSTTLRLIYAATGQVVNNQTRTLDFRNGTDIGNGGFRLKSTPLTAFTLPDLNHESYMVEFVGAGITQRAIIGYDIPT
jgi:hypothetical protein